MLTLHLLLPDCLPSRFHLQWCLDNSDPDPELKMVAMRIFPWMLIVVIHSITVWTCIAALLGEYVIPCICVFFLTGLGFLIFANLQANNWRQMSLVILCIDFVCSLFIFVGILSWIPFHFLSYLMPRTEILEFAAKRANWASLGSSRPRQRSELQRDA